MASPRQRISRFLHARLQLPLLSLLVLATVPNARQNSNNLVFTLVPAWESIKALLSRRSDRLRLQQWLSYWLLLAGCRVLENTRVDLDLDFESLSNILKSLPSFILSKLSLPSRTSAPSSSSVQPRKQTLAVKLAGSSTRWLVLKAFLLFFAMDKEIQGANWLLHKVVKPLVAFFTSIEEGPEDEELEYTSDGRSGRRSRRKDGNIAYRSKDERTASEAEEAQEEYIQATPELSLDETDSSSSTSSTPDLSSGGSGDSEPARLDTRTYNSKAAQDTAWDTNYWTA